MLASLFSFSYILVALKGPDCEADSLYVIIRKSTKGITAYSEYSLC